jgi:signal transduction histidine kinase
VCEALRDTFTLLRHSPDIKENHVLELVLPKEPILISADSTQLKQIFWNLARNAVQAMPAGGVFRAELQQAPQNRAKIIFSDTGCGMTSKQVEQLFEPFSNSTNGGTGLGLSIVYQIIRDHNGTINVRSRENEGTTITVELPCEARAQTAIDEAEELDISIAPSRLKSFLNVKSEQNNLSS